MGAVSVRRDLDLLFAPGSGTAPPLLAGREEALETMDRQLRLAQSGKGRIVVLIGPRGNGKTALAERFAEICRKEGIVVSDGDPESFGGDSATPATLARWLLKDRLSRRLESAEVAGVAANWKNPDIDEALLSTFRKSLLDACRGETRFALIDEAHTLPPAAGKFLLNAAQHVNKRGGAFLLVLAGTPQLTSALRKAEASFWSRCLPIGIGRISAEATREALEKPLAEHGVAFEPEALGEVVEESQRYPYFIQLWGEALARALPEGADAIGLATVESARPRFESAKIFYYEDRCEELKGQGLLPAAEAAARAFETCGFVPAPDETFEREIARATGTGENEAAQAAERLRNLGFIWKPPGEKLHEPGIPSLMKHVLDKSETPGPETSGSPAP